MSVSSRPQTINGALYARLAAYKELLQDGTEREQALARAELAQWVLLRYIPAILRMKYPGLGFDVDREGIIAEAQLLVWKRCEGIHVADESPAHPALVGGLARSVSGSVAKDPRSRSLCRDAPTLQAIEWSRSPAEILRFIESTARGALREAMRGLDPCKRVARERSREFAQRMDEIIAQRRRTGDHRQRLTALERRQLLAEVAPNATVAMLQRVEHGRVAGEEEALVASEPLGPEEIVTSLGDARARRRVIEEIAALDRGAARVVARAFAGETIGARDRAVLGRTEGVLARLHAYLDVGGRAGVPQRCDEPDDVRRELIQRVARVDFVAAMIVKHIAAGGDVGAWERERLRATADVVSMLLAAGSSVAGLASVASA